jgi:hypothetical protein
MAPACTIVEALKIFAAAVTNKSTQLTSGEPEDQLRAPFERFMSTAAEILGSDVVCTGETPLPDRLGRPDFAVHASGLLAGYVELKAPGVGATASRFRGRNREQFKRFSAIPNILYTDGIEWALYRSGEREGRVVKLPGDVAVDGAEAVDDRSAGALEGLLRDFLAWHPILPTDRQGNVDLKGFAELLAPLCRLLRDDVKDAVTDPESPLVELAADWRRLLFPGAPDDQFADAYAQTVAFALLLGRSEGADPLGLETAESALAAQHSLLSRALQVLTDERIHAEMPASLGLLLRVIAEVPPAAFGGSSDPWLYFYEHFLAIYDPGLRRDIGAYYTPVEVVHAQVRLIDDLLVNRLDKPLGFADSDVVTLDPAVGTGTYLLGVVEHALGRVADEQGEGAVAGQATALAQNLCGFELLVGPYAVAEMRVSRALRDRGGSLPEDGTHVYLTDTLESPHATPPQLGFFLKPLAEQHAKALRLKADEPVIVCLGNPPYDRHEAARDDNLSRTGGWVRWGTDGDGAGAIFASFLDPVIAGGHGVHAKNLYNLYVYFWRWALWKVFEHSTASGPGIVSFISASSYLDGDAFCGMREQLRRLCDEIWILDLGGEGRGTRKTENVFSIQTPVAIAIGVRDGLGNAEKPAKVHYAKIEGTRQEKLATLENLSRLDAIRWRNCPKDWQAPLRPAGRGQYFGWPLLTDLMPWQHTGCEVKRTWPICSDTEALEARWRNLLRIDDRAIAYKETRDRKLDRQYTSHTGGEKLRILGQVRPGAAAPQSVRYGFRSFDRQWLLADGRLGDYLRPVLWRVQGPRQVFLTTLFNHPLGDGPAGSVTAFVPDRHHYRGSYGGKDVLPLYRDAHGREGNILRGLLAMLSEVFRRETDPEDFAGYVYGILAHPSFAECYAGELESREIRVPITKSAALFERVRELGAHLLWLHTYGERFVPKGKRKGRVPRGSAKCVRGIPDRPDAYPEGFEFNEETHTLLVGQGEFAPVTPEVFEFQVSGLRVVHSWLAYRMKAGAGKKSSPLDDIRPTRWTSDYTTELLELLWVLEATLEVYPELAELLEDVVEGACFTAEELPAVPEDMRKPPSRGEKLFE